jgi:hypothetical protein
MTLLHCGGHLSIQLATLVEILAYNLIPCKLCKRNIIKTFFQITSVYEFIGICLSYKNLKIQQDLELLQFKIVKRKTPQKNCMI